MLCCCGDVLITFTRLQWGRLTHTSVCSTRYSSTSGEWGSIAPSPAPLACFAPSHCTGSSRLLHQLRLPLVLLHTRHVCARIRDPSNKTFCLLNGCPHIIRQILCLCVFFYVSPIEPKGFSYIKFNCGLGGAAVMSLDWQSACVAFDEIPVNFTSL